MKSITTNARENNALGIMHLFEFEMKNFDGSLHETLRFTDHDVFVNDGTNEWTPLDITFNSLTEDFSMQSDNISVVIDNINRELSALALGKEWRNNRAKIIRVIYTPPDQTEGGNLYEFGVSDNSTADYPRFEISAINKDEYILFEGIIDTFTASAGTLTANLATKFSNWNTPYPTVTFNQNSFTSIVSAVSDVIYWGRQKTI